MEKQVFYKLQTNLLTKRNSKPSNSSLWEEKVYFLLYSNAWSIIEKIENDKGKESSLECLLWYVGSFIEWKEKVKKFM
jgi:hypothetical protein